VPLALAAAALAVFCLMAARAQQRLASFSAAPAAVGALQAAVIDPEFAGKLA